MLNELDLLARSIEAKGLAVESWDDRIKSFKKGHAYVARLRADGEVATVEWMDKDRVSELRRISPQNEKSFPGFNLNHAIFDAIPERIGIEALSSPSLLLQHIQNSIQTLSLAGEQKDRRALEMQFRYPGQDLKQGFLSSSDGLKPTLALIERIEQLPVERFLRSLGLAALRSVDSGKLTADQAIDLLLGNFNEKKKSFESKKPTLILDLDDPEILGGRIASLESARAWNNALLRAKPTAAADSIVCSLAGTAQHSTGDKMPQPNLPGLGLTYLMSMNKATPCQMRYGLTSSSIFPVGRTSAQRICDALQFITSVEREGKTFARVPNAHSDSTDLLIAYLETEPASDLNVVDLFADMAESPESATADYAARTQALFKAIKGRNLYRNDASIRIFAINKLDPGRSQVLFSGCYSLSRMELGFAEWFRGAENIPPFSLLLPAAKGQKAILCEPARPSPIDVLKSFKCLWMRSGKESSAVPGVELSRIYRLMFEPSPEEAATLLARYLQLVEALMIGVGALRLDLKILQERAKREVLVAIPVLGILLLKFGRSKEVYMQSREFLLGQYLQLADGLHKLYCDVVRSGSCPPQLAGNAALGAALQHPERAFQTVSQRIRVYWAWADSFRGDDRAGLAKWFRREISNVCGQLQVKGLSGPIDDAGRAQLFLGYLGKLAKEDRQ